MRAFLRVGHRAEKRACDDCSPDARHEPGFHCFIPEFLAPKSTCAHNSQRLRRECVYASAPSIAAPTCRRTATSGRVHAHWHTEGAAPNTSRVMALVTGTPSTEYVSVPVMPSENAARIVPTVLNAIAVQGTVLNAGPVVRKRSPEKEPSVCLFIVATSHMPVPFEAYVKSVAKMMVPWCVKLMPHPDSEPAGMAHHRSW